jgi:hypothetical protein
LTNGLPIVFKAVLGLVIVWQNSDHCLVPIL